MQECTLWQNLHASHRSYKFGTEGRELIVRPLFRRDAVLCEAVVAKPSRIESAVHTWAAQHLYRAHGQHLELPRRRIHGHTVGRRAGSVRAGVPEPDACGQSCYHIALIAKFTGSFRSLVRLAGLGCVLEFNQMHRAVTVTTGGSSAGRSTGLCLYITPALPHRILPAGAAGGCTA